MASRLIRAACLARPLGSHKIRSQQRLHVGPCEHGAYSGTEHAPEIRAEICAGLEFLGVRLDSVRNETGDGDRVVSTDGSKVAVVTLATNEELIVARRAYAVLTRAAGR